MLKYFLFFLFLPEIYVSYGQVFPSEQAIVNYTKIGFSFPVQNKAVRYECEIARGRINAADSFREAIFARSESKTNMLIGDVPEFETDYTWRVAAYFAGSAAPKYGGLHHFSTGSTPDADTTITRLRVITKPALHNDHFVFLDGTKMLYDMSGRAIWYLPLDTVSINDETNLVIRDLKCSQKNTITYLIDKKNVYEADYDGKILWRGPEGSGQKKMIKDFYHHEFTRLNNGHYMALAQERTFWKQPDSITDTVLNLVPSSNTMLPGKDSKPMPMAMLVEYDERGHILWSWKASEHLKGTSIFHKIKNGTLTLVPGHENSFYFNEKDRVVYLSCRDINSIIKLRYPDGKVLNIYNGSPDKYCGQHSCRISSEGYLYLYNNNTCKSGQAPTVFVGKENVQMNLLEKIWEYSCDTFAIERKPDFASGGNVQELPDSSFFVSMAFPSGNIFIVNRKKEIIWSAVAEKWDNNEKRWVPARLYRASIITGQQLERLIWAHRAMPEKK